MTSKKKIVAVVVTLFVVGYVLGHVLPFSSIYAPSVTEHSYKTGNPVPRYLTSFQRAPQHYPEDKSDQIANAAAQKQHIMNVLERAGNSAQSFSWFDAIQNEHVYIYVTDTGNARFTVTINDDQYDIQEGFDTSEDPTMVVPITQSGLENLAGVLSDRNLTYQEKYMIYDAVSAPALSALYNTDPLYRAGDKSPFKFDDLVQITVPPEEPVMFEGKPLSIKLTAMNVDGQWIVTRGLHGDPDFRLTLTLDQATQLYQQGVYGVRNLSSISEARSLSDQFRSLLNETKTYTRSDHTK
jgi:hypothetical protein